MSSNILLLGEYNVGKSHFGGQLLGRLNQEQGYLRMVGSPDSLAAFEGVLSCLNDGRAAPHTSAAHYVESHWPVRDIQGNSTELIWPDYGGEQISSMRQNRSMPPEWTARVRSSDGWIVMLRIGNANVSDDIFSKPLGVLVPKINPETLPFQISDQARMVDFLQWLIFIRSTGTLKPIGSPKLLLLLSCWDELPAAEINEPPNIVLSRRLPMVSSFVQANWKEGSLHVLGLSALERSLSENQEDCEFIDKGPESIGYVVTETGKHESDLTVALKPLMQVD
jgi:hypothetical protein